MKNNNHFLAGAIFGGIIGGLTVLALSPKSGKGFRDNVMDKISQFKQNTDLQNSQTAEKESTNQTISLNQDHAEKNTKEEQSNYIALEQQIDKMIDHTSSPKGENLDIQKMLEETEKAFTDAEQKFQ